MSTAASVGRAFTRYSSRIIASSFAYAGTMVVRITSAASARSAACSDAGMLAGIIVNAA